MIKQKILSLFLSMILMVLTISCLSGCNYKPNPLLEKGNFVYKIRSNTDSSGKVTDGKKVVIYGLSEVGKKQKYLVVPETLDGYEVKDVGHVLWLNHQGFWESNILKKVYFTKSYYMPNRFFL